MSDQEQNKICSADLLVVSLSLMPLLVRRIFGAKSLEKWNFPTPSSNVASIKVPCSVIVSLGDWAHKHARM